MSGKRIIRTLSIVTGAAALAAAVYIMATGQGLQDTLDFGAGAYYYADIPEFDRYVRDDAFTTGIPYWVYVLLFLIWGALVYLLWVFIDRKR